MVGNEEISGVLTREKYVEIRRRGRRTGTGTWGYRSTPLVRNRESLVPGSLSRLNARLHVYVDRQTPQCRDTLMSWNSYTWWTFLIVRLMRRSSLKPHDTAHLAFCGSGEERCSRSGESWRMLKYPTINDENVLLRGVAASSLSPTSALSKSSLRPIMNRIPISSHFSTLPRPRSRAL